MPFINPEEEFAAPVEEVVPEPEQEQVIEPPDNSYTDTLRYVRQKRRQIMDNYAKRKATKQAESQGLKETGKEVAGNLGKKGLIRGEERLMTKGAQRAATQVGKQAGKAIAKTVARKGVGMGARWATEAATGVADAGLSWLLLAGDVLISGGLYLGKKYGGYIIGAIAVLLLLPAIIFSLMWGKTGPTLSPTTAAEKNSAIDLAGMGGSASASRESIVRWAQSSKTKFSNLKSIASQKLSGSRLSDFQSQTDNMIAQLDSLITLSGNTVERETTMKKTLSLMDQMTRDFPELLNLRDSCSKLAPYIASNMLEIGPQGKENARLVVKGLLKNKAGQVYPASPELCATLLSVVSSGIRLQSNTFSLGHEKYSGNKTSGTTISQHWCGEAIDIQHVNGVHVGHNEETRKAMEAIRLAADQGAGAWESFGPFYNLQLNDGKPYSKNIGGHDNHIHLSGKPRNIACLQDK